MEGENRPSGHEFVKESDRKMPAGDRRRPGAAEFCHLHEKADAETFGRLENGDGIIGEKSPGGVKRDLFP